MKSMDDSMVLSALSKNLKALRASLGFSIKKFSIQSNLPQTTFESYLYGISVPPLETFCSICSAFNISVNSLFEGLIDYTTEQDSLRQIDLFFCNLPEIKRSRIFNIIVPCINGMADSFPKLTKAKCGTRLRILRDDLGFSPEEVSESCGIEPITLKCYESSQAMPGASTFLNLCCKLSVSPTYLLINHVDSDISDVSKRLYDLTPRQLSSIALTSERLTNVFNG